MKKVYAGIDGGGSKTAAVIVDEQGRELGRGQAGPSNYQGVGLETAFASVRTALDAALMAAGLTVGPDLLILGLAGVDRPGDQALWQAALNASPPLAAQVELCGDFDLILYALPGRQGLGVIAGTGSIALGRDGRGQRVRSGGWGYFFGDEGSGLWLGRAALQAAARAADGRGPQTAMLNLILEEWRLAEPSDLIGAVYNSRGVGLGVDNARVARLAGLVIRAAEAGDDTARSLLRQAANELALAIKACDTRLFFPEPPGLAVAGGLLLNNPAFLATLTGRLETMMSLGRVVPVPDPALVAAQAAAAGSKS